MLAVPPKIEFSHSLGSFRPLVALGIKANCAGRTVIRCRFLHSSFLGMPHDAKPVRLRDVTMINGHGAH